MMRRRRPTLLVLGPSGAGKSSLGAHLAAAGFLHVEYDTARPGDFAVALQPGLDALRERSRIGPLLVALEAIEARHPVPGTVITFDSRMTFEPRNVAAIERAGLDLVVLYGTGAECLEGALARERARGTIAPPSEWVAHNERSYATFSLPQHAAHRVLAFRDGRFVGASALAVAVARHLARRNRAWDRFARAWSVAAREAASAPSASSREAGTRTTR